MSYLSHPTTDGIQALALQLMFFNGLLCTSQLRFVIASWEHKRDIFSSDPRSVTWRLFFFLNDLHTQWLFQMSALLRGFE